jgi:RNA polymerase sigma-70 factor (ECF subfamily)
MKNDSSFEREMAAFFDRLYADYHRHMEFMAYDILHNQQDAEDAVQEAFAAIYIHLPSLVNLEGFRIHYYILSVVRNKSIDLLRKRKQTISFEEIEKTSPDELLSFSSEEEQMEPIDSLLTLIYQMPALYRDVLGLYYVTGLSTKEIASSLGRSESSVRKQLQRGRDSLKKQWEEKMERKNRGLS